MFEWKRKKVKSLGRCNSVGMNALIVTTWGKHGSTRVEGALRRISKNDRQETLMIMMTCKDEEIQEEGNVTKVTNNVSTTQET